MDLFRTTCALRATNQALRNNAREADFEQYCRDLYRVTKGQFSVEAFENRRKITHPDARKKPVKEGEEGEKPKEVEPPHCVWPTWAALPPHIQVHIFCNRNHR